MKKLSLNEEIAQLKDLLKERDKIIYAVKKLLWGDNSYFHSESEIIGSVSDIKAQSVIESQKFRNEIVCLERENAKLWDLLKIVISK